MRNRRFHIVSLVLIAIVFSLVASVVAADFSLSDWRYSKPIVLPSQFLTQSLVELVPDREVFAESASGLVGLRIIADDGVEIPYKFEVSKGERQRNHLPVTLRDKGYVLGQYTTFVADLGHAEALHNEMEIHTSPNNFRRTATIETSTDSITWAKVAEQQVYDFTVKERHFTTRDTKITYPESTARYLRVRIGDEGEGPLEITGASVLFVKETLAREVLWPSTIMSTSRDDDRRATLVVVDLGSHGLPTHRLAIDVPDVNFYREVTLEASNDVKEWRTIRPTAAVYAYDTPKFVGEDLGLTYSEDASRYLRLVIHDEDSPPLTVQSVDVWGLRRRLVFTASPNRSYQLYYGNPEAWRPSYDILSKAYAPPAARRWSGLSKARRVE